MRKNFNTFIMSHVKLVNLVLSIFYLALFVVMFLVKKLPMDGSGKESYAAVYFQWMKHSIYKYHSFQEWFFYILVNLGLLGNVLLILYLIIISLFNKRIIKLLSILTFLCIIFLLIPFMSGITLYIILSSLLFIVILTISFVNIKYKKNKEDIN